MDLTLYHHVIQHLPDKPDLTVVQQNLPVPADWPLAFKGVQLFRKQVQCFTMTDGSSTVDCISSIPEIYDRVAMLEKGAIIHLTDVLVKFDSPRKTYILDVLDFCTLKEYDQKLKTHQKAEEERQARLLEEAAQEANLYENSGQPE